MKATDRPRRNTAAAASRRADRLAQRRIGLAFAPGETATLVHSHGACVQSRFAQREQPHGQRVDHFIRDEHAAPRLERWRVHPFNVHREMRATLLQRLALARAQVGAALEQPVAQRQRAETFEFEQQVGGERAAAGPEFEDIGTAFSQCRRDRACQTSCENESEFRRRDEITGRAEFRLARAVIAQPRRVQRQLHVAGEVEHAACVRNLATNQRREPLAVRGFFEARRRQVCVHAGNLTVNRLQLRPMAATA